MIDILQWDEQLFQLINGSWQTPLLDSVMPLWRNKYFWIPLYVFIASFFLLNFKKQGAFLILAIGLTVGTADFVSSSIIKKSVQRLRPCNTEILRNDINLLVRCGSGYSFPSSHAANHFAMAVMLFFTLGKVLKRTRIPLLIWAGSIAFGQVYVGVHYPLDAFMGSLLGILIGIVGAFFTTKLLPHPLTLNH
ncbi:MAG: membrane-associated phospholipid phosphatase [Paraglaciecola sp.]|jgi:membrane-associated phospholipid phosphatase